MINIDQSNQIERENEPANEFIEEQPELDQKIYNFIPDAAYVCNELQANQNPTISAITTSTQFSLFQLPSSVYDFSKTTLALTLTVTAPAYTVNSVIAMKSFHCGLIQQLEFYTSSGTRLFNCANVDKLTRLSGILNLEHDKSGTRCFMGKSQRNYLRATIAPTIGSQTADPYVINTTLGLALAPAQSLDDPIVNMFPYLQASTYNSTTGSGDTVLLPDNVAAQGSIFRLTCRLGDLLPDSIFNTSKNLWMSKVSYIKITWNSVDQVFIGAQLDQLTGTTSTTLQNLPASSTYSITNMALNIYSQINSDINNAIMESQKMSSLPVVIPYVDVASQIFPSSITQNATFKVSTNNPVARLYKLYYGLFRSDFGSVVTCDSNNINELALSNTMVKINNTTIRSYVDLSKREDIQEMIKYFPFNSITSYRSIRYSGSYGIVLDTTPCKQFYDGSELSGLEIKPSNDVLISYVSALTTAQPLTHFLFSVKPSVFFWFNGEAYYVKQGQ